MRPDEKIWAVWRDRLADVDGESPTRALAISLINYPWTRLVRTNMFFEDLVHFGIEPVHNDVLFHWLSLALARRVAFIDSVGVVHRYHHPSKHVQTTRVGGQERESLHAALRLVHRRLASQKALWAMGVIKPNFHKTVVTLLEWAASKFPGLSRRFHRECAFTRQCTLEDDEHACVRVWRASDDGER